MKTFCFILLFYSLLLSVTEAQDEFVQIGNFIPRVFSELVDVESLSQDTVYTVGVGGIFFVDVSQPENPQLIGTFNPGSILKRFYNADIKDNLALGAARLDGLYVIDVSSLESPSLITIYSNEGISYESVAYHEGFAYCAVHDRGIEVIDLREPFNPVSMGFLISGKNIWDVEIKDNFLYAADGPNGIQIYELADLELPHLLSQIPTSGYCKEIRVSGNKAFVALGAAGFDIIDVSEPQLPKFIINFSEVFGIINHLDISGNTVFTSNWELVLAIDIANPFTPFIKSTEDTPVRAMGIAANNNQVFVADWSTMRIYTYANFDEPDIHVKPTLHDFGFNDFQMPISKTFQVYNMGEGPLVIDSIIIDENSSEEIPSDVKLFSVEPNNLIVNENSFKEINVTFRPPTKSTSTNSFLGNMKFLSNDPDESLKQLNLYAGGNRPADESLAPGFTLQNLSGEFQSLSDFRGKVVLLVLFASW